MSIIQNIQKRENILEFDFINDSTHIHPSLTNSIRRTILSDIETWAIDSNKIQFYDNTSILDNEFIAHRLTLIPIRSDIQDIDYDDVHIQCQKRNDTDDVMSVYVSDFVVTNKQTKEVIPTEKIFPYMRILLLKLRIQQSISFECSLKIGSPVKGDSSVHCSVCTCVQTFGVDENKVREETKNMSNDEKKSYMVMESSRNYKKNSRNEAEIIHFLLESIDQYEVTDIMNMGIDLLMKRLIRFKEDLLAQNERIEIQDGSVYEDIYEISVNDETDTLANVVTAYVGFREEVNYVGYVIRHPLMKNVLFRVKLNENNTIDNIYRVFGEAIDEIVGILNKMKESF